MAAGLTSCSPSSAASCSTSSVVVTRPRFTSAMSPVCAATTVAAWPQHIAGPSTPAPGSTPIRSPCSATMPAAYPWYVATVGAATANRSRSAGSVSGCFASAPSRSLTRAFSSPAALRVKVSPSTASGATSWLATSQATRAAMVSVFPEPAPATTTSGRSTGADTTPACSGDGAYASPQRVATSAGLSSRGGSGDSAVGRPGRSKLSCVTAPPRRRSSSLCLRVLRPWATSRARSPGHLPAGLLHGTAAPERAPLAVGVGAGGEAAAAHPLPHLGDELTRPGLPGVDVGRQRRLVVFLRCLLRPADLQQCRAAGDGAVPGERPLGDRDLIGRQLSVLLHGARRRLAGLEVDDDQPPLGARFQPVDLPAQPRPADDHVEVLLGGDQLPVAAGVPGDELGEHLLRALPLPLVEPARTEVQPVELGVEHRGGLRRRQPLGDLLGDVVHGG